MVTWMIWIKDDFDYTWLQESWTDDMTSENNEGWQEAVHKARKMALENNYEMRIMKVLVPGVHEAFDIPEVTAL